MHATHILQLKALKHAHIPFRARDFIFIYLLVGFAFRFILIQTKNQLQLQHIPANMKILKSNKKTLLKSKVKNKN